MRFVASCVLTLLFGGCTYTQGYWTLALPRRE